MAHRDSSFSSLQFTECRCSRDHDDQLFVTLFTQETGAGVSKAEVSESAQHLAVPFTICCAPTPSPKLLTTAVTPPLQCHPQKMRPGKHSYRA